MKLETSNSPILTMPSPNEHQEHHQLKGVQPTHPLQEDDQFKNIPSKPPLPHLKTKKDYSQSLS